MSDGTVRIAIAGSLAWVALATTVILGTHGEVVSDLWPAGAVLEAQAPLLELPYIELPDVEPADAKEC